MLLNLSNHPSHLWSEHQLSEARRQFGAVTDMPFPIIPPEAATDEVRMMAEQLLLEIRKIDPSAVHLMGEMTCCFMLLSMLHDIGIPCYASTTHRSVIVENDGIKTTQFTFVQFRRYG